MDNSFKVYFSWREVQHACQAIVKELGDWVPDVIMPITRGGLIPGTMISHMLGIKCVIPTGLQTRDGSAGELDQIWMSACAKSDTKILVVDDILDSGRTIELMLAGEPGPNIKFAALIVNQDAPVISRQRVMSGHDIHKDSNPTVWIVFPWEV